MLDNQIINLNKSQLLTFDLLLLTWSEAMIEAEIVSESKFILLLQEAKEITNILAASIRSLKKKNF